MNICITNHDIQPHFIGGIKRVISILSKEWGKKCNVFIISVAPKGTKYDIFNGSSLFFLPNCKNILTKENEEFFSNVIKQNKIDIILHPYALETEFTKLCIRIKQTEKVKLITALHFSPTHDSQIFHSYFFNTYRLGNNIITWIKELALYIKYHLSIKHKVEKREILHINKLIEDSDILVLLSNAYINCLKGKIKDDDIKKIIAINNPAPYYSYSTTTATKKEKQILWCGRVEYSMKRVDRMIDIWKDIALKYPDWELIIMGSGNIEYFKNLTKKLQIPNITFTGSCDPTQYYTQGAILCMTSSTEGLPMVLIEAMLFGCATIAYNSFESLQDVIVDGVNGYTITPFNKKEYIHRLETLITNDELRERFGKNGMESVKKFNREIIAKRWIELFQETLKEQ